MLLSVLFASYTIIAFNQDTIGADQIKNCFASRKYSIKTLSKDLTGSWKLAYKRCYWADRRGQKIPLPDVTVTFYPNGNYIIFEDSITVLKGKWEIAVRYNSFWLQLDQNYENLGSTIQICKNEFYFSDYGSDGCEYLYKRIL